MLITISITPQYTLYNGAVTYRGYVCYVLESIDWLVKQIMYNLPKQI